MATLALLIGLQLDATYGGLAPDRVRPLPFFALMGAIMALVLVNRSFSTSLMNALRRHNASLCYVAAAVVVASGMMVLLALVRRILDCATLELMDLPVLIATPLEVLGLCEFVKGQTRRIT